MGVLFISPQALNCWLEAPLLSNWCHLPGQHQVLISVNWPLPQSQAEKSSVFQILAPPTTALGSCLPPNSKNLDLQFLNPGDSNPRSIFLGLSSLNS